VVGIALVGCTPAGPTAPEVVWESGAPSGELESSPWVEAVRASDLALNTAFVTRDYTGDALKESTSSTLIDLAATAQVSVAKGDRFYTIPGPTPMIPLEVDENGDEATVTVCQAVDWYLDAEQTAAPTALRGRVMEFQVGRDEDGTVRSQGGAEVAGSDECDLDGVSVGLFDPQPDPAETYSPDDVKVP
jgi:hypothetical protein